jgi:ATP-dependent exoDNAse (exonuclease V) beta subunit
MTSIMKNILAANFPNERDKNIKFFSQGHRYEIQTDLKKRYTSVTTFVHQQFPKFDADAVIAKIFGSKSWGPDHKYWGQTAEEIKASWTNSGAAAAGSGTNLHEQIEIFMNDPRFTFIYTHNELLQEYEIAQQYKSDPVSPEWEFFIQFVRDHPHLKPYRTEWMIYHEDAKIAGSIDMVYENPDGTLAIYDWKRCKEITKVNGWNETATNPIIGHLPATNFWQYSLQLNTYRRILEEKYGKRVTKLCLVRLHPDATDGTYELLEVPLLDKEMDDLFAEKINKMK